MWSWCLVHPDNNCSSLSHVHRILTHDQCHDHNKGNASRFKNDPLPITRPSTVDAFLPTLAGIAHHPSRRRYSALSIPLLLPCSCCSILYYMINGQSE